MGTGISTIVIGDGVAGSNGFPENPGWVTCKRLASNPNERVVSIEGDSKSMVLYIETDRVGGCVEDPDTGGAITFYLNCDLFCPQVDNDGSIGGSTRNLCVLNNPNSSYTIDIGTIQANGASLFILGGGTGLGYGASSIQVKFANMAISTLGSGNAIVVNSGANFLMDCQYLYTYASGYSGSLLQYNGGAFIFTGYINLYQGSDSASYPVQLTASGLVLKDTYIQRYPTNSAYRCITGDYSVTCINVSSSHPLATGVVVLQPIQITGTYTLSTLPTVTASGTIIVSNATGGQVLCYSDGTHWISVKTGIPVN